MSPWRASASCSYAIKSRQCRNHRGPPLGYSFSLSIFLAAVKGRKRRRFVAAAAEAEDAARSGWPHESINHGTYREEIFYNTYVTPLREDKPAARCVHCTYKYVRSPFLSRAPFFLVRKRDSSWSNIEHRSSNHE